MSKSPFAAKVEDRRPRFGWAMTLDNDPQQVFEKKRPGAFPVAVIPMPFISPTQKRKVKDFTNGTVWPQE